MSSHARVLLLVGCLAASGCFGGPTSDWPAKADDDETSGPTGLDAGRKPPASIDAASPAPSVEDRPCSPAADAGIPLDAGASAQSDASSPDAGCR